MCGLGHVWGEICNGMLLGNPARGRPMLLASDELTAALKFQRQLIILSPSQYGIESKKIIFFKNTQFLSEFKFMKIATI